MSIMRALAVVGLCSMLAACENNHPGPGAQPGTGGAGAGSSGSGGAGGDGRIPLVDWVDDLAENHNGDTDQPDTVEDKLAIVIDTDDPAAFDPLLQHQP